MSYEKFRSEVRSAAAHLAACTNTIRIVSHLDCDGISAAAILSKALTRRRMRHVTSVVQQINEAVMAQLAKESYRTFAFTDIGSGQLSLIRQFLGDRQVFVLDHHEIEWCEHGPNLLHVNPHMHGIDGDTEISGAGVVYLVCREMDEANKDLAHIAVIAGLGECQEKNGFTGLNNEILKEAVAYGKIRITNGLRLFGANSKPLHKLLEHSTDSIIPGVTGSESGAIQFLSQLGISPKNGSKWRKFSDLTDEEAQRLVAGIIVRRHAEKQPEEVIGNVYTLPSSEISDAREFSTLLNSCGRLGKSSLGIGACLEDKRSMEKAMKNLASYKRELVRAFGWYSESQGNGHILRGSNYLIINAQENVMPTMIGTLASILSKSHEFPEGTYILSLARMLDGNTKVSIRVATNGSSPANGYNLAGMIGEIASKVGGRAGGHKEAAGAIIKTDTEEDFIDAARKHFEGYKPSPAS